MVVDRLIERIKVAFGKDIKNEVVAVKPTIGCYCGLGVLVLTSRYS